MIKSVPITGYCPVQNKDVTIKVDYAQNLDCWEKETGECAHAMFNTCPVAHCPIVYSASSTLESI